MTVFIQNINDNPSIFQSQGYNVKIDKNTPPGLTNLLERSLLVDGASSVMLARYTGRLNLGAYRQNHWTSLSGRWWKTMGMPWSSAKIVRLNNEFSFSNWRLLLSTTSAFSSPSMENFYRLLKPLIRTAGQRLDWFTTKAERTQNSNSKHWDLRNRPQRQQAWV